jgi:hypothetical protein
MKSITFILTICFVLISGLSHAICNNDNPFLPLCSTGYHCVNGACVSDSVPTPTPIPTPIPTQNPCTNAMLFKVMQFYCGEKACVLVISPPDFLNHLADAIPTK